MIRSNFPYEDASPFMFVRTNRRPKAFAVPSDWVPSPWSDPGDYILYHSAANNSELGGISDPDGQSVHIWLENEDHLVYNAQRLWFGRTRVSLLTETGGRFNVRSYRF